jgi:hypothetical protein
MPGAGGKNIGAAVVGVVMAVASGGLAQLSADDPAPPAPAAAEASAEPDVVTAVQEVLGRLEVAPELGRQGYRRSSFRHWVDADGDGCDAREEVLLAERRDGQPDGCEVLGGRWFSVYDSESTTEPGTFDIDHVVALGEAWDSGAKTWTDDRRERYANDLGFRHSLIAVTAGSNRGKGDRDPAEWVPPRRAVWCRYATWWTAVKIRWSLTADEDEVAALRDLFVTCTSPPQVDVPPAP